MSNEWHNGHGWIVESLMKVIMQKLCWCKDKPLHCRRRCESCRSEECVCSRLSLFLPFSWALLSFCLVSKRLVKPLLNSKYWYTLSSVFLINTTILCNKFNIQSFFSYNIKAKQYELYLSLGNISVYNRNCNNDFCY